MNMPALQVRRNDDLPDLYFRVYDRESCTFVDLSASTTIVTAKFRERGDDTVLQTITGTKVSDRSLGPISSMGRLRNVDLQRTEVTEDGISRLRRAKPTLDINPLELRSP